MTNLEVELSVTDTATGEIRNYANPQGVAFATIADTAAFGCPSGVAKRARHPEEPRDDDPGILSAPPVAGDAAETVPGCAESDSVLCLDGRFLAEAWWETASGRTGVAHAVSMTSGSGYFWFFDPDNVELVVKTLDACSIGRGQWFFSAGLTSVRVVLQVTDTFTGEIHSYDGFGFPARPIQQTNSFASCTEPDPPTPREHPVFGSCSLFEPWSCRFFPSIIHIPVGDSINWYLLRGGHSTISGFPDAPDGIWDSGSSIAYTREFTEAGTYPYYCRRHLETGTVIVGP
jgi:hypothetical protein